MKTIDNANIKITFGRRVRLYLVGDSFVPSITSIIECLQKYALIQWAANCAVEDIQKRWPNSFDGWTEEQYEMFFNEARGAHNRISEEAKEKGTDLHSLAELYFTDIAEYEKQMVDVDNMTKKVMDNFVDFCAVHKIKPHLVEEKVYGDGYAGRFDLICFMDNKFTLIDIKKSKGYYAEYGLQLAANRLAWDYATQEHKIEEMGIIRLDVKTGGVNYKSYTDQYDKLAKAFIALTQFYWESNNLKEQFEELKNAQNAG